MENVVIEDRKIQEKDFHNQRESDRNDLSGTQFEQKYSNRKFYSINRKINVILDDWMGSKKGKVVLDYCCGSGLNALDLAKHGATVYGIDISDNEVRHASETLEKEGFKSTTFFQVMDAENMTFEDNFFDAVLCSGVLHHLDVNKAFPELARVLKPDGEILCYESLGHNPLFRLYRKMTPHLRTAWEVDHILKVQDLAASKKYFKEVQVKFFFLFALLAVPFRRLFIFKPILSLFEAIDSVVLKIPFVQRMAWQMVFVLKKPIK
jgi:ubiquinone/menaquinone biosynthesis C-methylase UbiE